MDTKSRARDGRTEPGQIGAAVSSALIEQFEELDAEEQAIVGAMIARATRPGRGDARFDAVSFIHRNLESEPADGAAFDDLESKKAPPVVKLHRGAETISLPRDIVAIDASIVDALERRASSHHFAPDLLTLKELGALLHHSYGVKRYISAYNVARFPVRMAPSAGGLQSIDLHLVANRVEGARAGLYSYDPLAHALVLLDEGDMRFKVMHACTMQEWVAHAAVVFIMSCNFSRLEWKYGKRAYRLAHIDSGVLTENMYLIGAALGMTTCAIAGYDDERVNDLLHVDGDSEFATLLFALGKSRRVTSAAESLL
jgi:SagB-type dehydrogenase family enzyme